MQRTARLNNQRLVGPRFATPDEAVRWLGAVQAQDYGGAKWAVAQRTVGSTEVEIEQAFASGSILRTHLLRPTWHFVAPADLRWMLELTAPRVKAACAYAYRAAGLDDATLRRSDAALARALEGGKLLTRDELAPALSKAGIRAQGIRLGHLTMHAELSGAICSGPRRGKQFTYALLDERVAKARRSFDRDEALAELTFRYFRSRGPASAQDFAWWSGLPVADAKRGIQMNAARLVAEGASWCAPSAAAPLEKPIAHLLPNYDEYLVAYKDRSMLPDAGPRALASNLVLMNGQVIGTWRRALAKRAATIEATLAAPLPQAQRRALQEAAESHGRFLGLPVELVLSSRG